MTNITDLLTKIVNSNQASTSNSGFLPSNTIANPKGELKAITTRSVSSYEWTSNRSTIRWEVEIRGDKGTVLPNGKKLLNNKDKILELTKTPVNENCSAVILKTFPEKLETLIISDTVVISPELDECLGPGRLSVHSNQSNEHSPDYSVLKSLISKD
ncbi:hypothetical protein Tco_1404103 [Tanacetum coccineum]